MKQQNYQNKKKIVKKDKLNKKTSFVSKNMKGFFCGDNKENIDLLSKKYKIYGKKDGNYGRTKSVKYRLSK